MSAAEEVIITTRLAGERQVTSGLTREAVATDALAASTERAGLAMVRTQKRTWLMTQAIFTARRFMYMGTLALTAFSVAALKWGWDFNHVMQQGRISLGALLGSTAAANAELHKLFLMAAYNPLRFQDMVQASGIMLAFGISVKTTNRTLQDLIDALVATGKATPAGLNRVSTALGHMMSIGHATGQVLLQLARDGIPSVYDAVKKYFGLSAKQMEHIGALNLPANMVLDAINQSIEQSRMHGLARKQATGSLHGVWTTFQDFMGQLMGEIENRPFIAVQRLFNRINPAIARMTKGFKTGGFKGMFEAMTGGAAAQGWQKNLQLFIQYWSNIWTIMTTEVIPVVHAFLNALRPMGLLLMAAAGATSFLAHHQTLMKVIITILIIDFIRLKMAVIYFAVAERSAAVAMFFAGRAATYARIATALYTLWVLRAEYATLLLTKAQFVLRVAIGLQVVALGILGLAFDAVKLRMAIMLVSMRLMIFRFALLRIATVLAGIALLAFRWAVVLTAGAIGLLRDAWIGMTIAMEGNPIGLLVLAVALLALGLYKLFYPLDQIGNKLRAIGDWIRKNSLIYRLISWWEGWGAQTGNNAGQSAYVRGAASGTLNTGQNARLGQAIRMRTPVAAAAVGDLTFDPQSHQGRNGGDFTGRPQVIELHVDGKKMAQVVAEHKDDVRARR